MKSFFIVPFRAGTKNLYGTALLPDLGSMEGSGWSVIGEVPQQGLGSCLVQVCSSTGTIDAMKADPGYLHLEDIFDADN